MIRRRTLLRAGVGGAALGVSGAAYALAIEPGFRLRVQEWRLPVPGWGGRPPLTVAALADLHAGDPHMPLARVERIVAATNALRPDLAVILGDLPAHHHFVTRPVPMPEVARALAALRAPLGVHAILGNHDWWDDPAAEGDRRGPPAIRRALEAAGVPVLANHAVRLAHGEGVWLAGLDSQWAFRLHGGGVAGMHDLSAATAAITDDAPAILLAHEPDIFPDVPGRFAVTLSGHTHGGQVRLFGWSPLVPSIHHDRYAYGVIAEAGHHLVVSGGLGCSILPVRFGVPPEITLVRLGG